jgi:hypothetical protein
MGKFTILNSKISAAAGALVISMAFITAAVGPAATASNGTFYTAVQASASVQDQQA